MKYALDLNYKLDGVSYQLRGVNSPLMLLSDEYQQWIISYPVHLYDHYDR
jgi:hypothetical protein